MTSFLLRSGGHQTQRAYEHCKAREYKKRKLKDRQYDIGELIKSPDEADDTFTKRLGRHTNRSKDQHRQEKHLAQQ